MLKYLSILLLFLTGTLSGHAQRQLLIPMDASQTDHLKAYGLIFNNLQEGRSSEWLLNYRGGSFMTDYSEDVVRKSRLKNIKIEILSPTDAADIMEKVQNENSNTSVVQLDKAPKIAVYTPKQALPWDDAVTLALTYAEVDYDKVWDPEVLNGELSQYDWLHLHHEDFTGQYGKFWVSSRNRPWYIQQVNQMQAMAREMGFQKVSEEKKAVAR
ncbi:MAG: asparagine synthetase B, partial [Balneolaceae bacterium]|nr:asparagine synthetase B [Balneolaceae bacterium]